MAFFVQLGQDPYRQQAGQLGQALGEGISKRFADPQQLVQRKMLSEALSNLPENSSYLDVLKIAGPQLLTTPGGANLLAEMGPLLQKKGSADAYLDYLKKNQPPGNKSSTPSPEIPGQGALDGVPKEKSKPLRGSRDLQPPIGPEGTYPQQTAGPTPKPLMTPEEKQQKRLDLSMQYGAQGAIPDPVAIENAINLEDQARINYNAQIEQERQTRESKQQQQTARMQTRFENSSITPRSREDKTIFEKFANEAKNANTEEEAYQYARQKFNQFENARQGLIREADIPGFATKMYRQAIGTYKSKENVIKDLQPHIKKFKELGLENEARNILSNDVGLGMEDVELAMYPLSDKEKQMYNSMKFNPSAKNVALEGSAEEFARFPGEESSLKPQQFMDFKEQINDFLKSNPEANLIGMRGILNYDKKYSWVDISRAVVELIDEGRFQPDRIQEQELNVIKSPPVPGLGAIFKDFWKGTR